VTRRPALATVVALVALIGGAGVAGAAKPKAAPKPPSLPVTVFAASSLTDAFPAIDAHQTYSFAGSNTLATQIANGAPADVFASANTAIPSMLYAQGLVEKPVDFTRNTLVIVVPRSNRASVTGVYDLAKPGIRVDIANASVPVGSYTLAILKNMNLTAPVLANVVSQENDVRTVLTKVALGQVDAGFVYATDAKAAAGDVTVLKLPAWAQPKVTYAMAVVTRSPHQAAAQAFVKEVLSRAGQAKLQYFGFLALPPGSST